MSEKLEFTGERFTPESVREIWYEHYHRYVFARQLVGGKSVLDAACGEGYGSAILASTATSVMAVDHVADVIAHAANRYTAQSNLQFSRGDCTHLEFSDNQFEVVVSFETLEHLHEQRQMLREFRRVLKPQGLLVISSPDKKTYSEATGFDNPYHVKELYREQLQQLLATEFAAVNLLGHKLAFQSVIWDMHKSETVAIHSWAENHVSTEPTLPLEPVYYIALCAAEPAFLPDLAADMFLFGDTNESVYKHYYHEIRKNMAAGELLQLRDKKIAELEQELARTHDPDATPDLPAAWWRRLVR